MPLDDDLLPMLDDPSLDAADDQPLEPSMEPMFDELSVEDDERRPVPAPAWRPRRGIRERGGGGALGRGAQISWSG
jgi:hypothetical protein